MTKKQKQSCYPKKPKLKERPQLSVRQAAGLENTFKTLGNGTRLRILHALSHSLSQAILAGQLGADRRGEDVMWNLVKDARLLFGRLFSLPTKPGLRRVGNPNRSSPVLVTCNFDLTVRKVIQTLQSSKASRPSRASCEGRHRMPSPRRRHHLATQSRIVVPVRAMNDVHSGR